MKKNGFTWPLHPYQIFSWVVFLSNCIVTYALITPISPKNLNLLVYVSILTASFMLLILFGFFLTYFNPQIMFSPDTDRLSKHLDYFCSICNCFVTEDAKHCSQCNKCIEGFDHHCLWLNNCIGSKNYRSFLLLLSVLQTNDAMIIGLEAWFLVENPEASIIPVIIIHLCISLAVFCGNGYLMLYHLWLKLNNLSTYQHILLKRKKLKENKIQQEPTKYSKEHSGTLMTNEYGEKGADNKEEYNRSMIENLKRSIECETKQNKTQEIYLY